MIFTRNDGARNDVLKVTRDINSLAITNNNELIDYQSYFGRQFQELKRLDGGTFSEVVSIDSCTDA